MQQPTVVILPLIFSKLDFKEIKSCRLVNEQWHRYALDNVNLVLYVEDHGPTRSRKWIPERHGVYSPREVISPDRFHCRLVPCTAKATKENLNNFCLPELPRDAPKPKKFFFDEINDGIGSFKQRIKMIALVFKGSNERMHPVLQTFIANFPAAKLIVGGCEELGIGYKFEEDKSVAGLDSRAAAMKLRELKVGGENPGDVTTTATIIAPFIQQAANEAASIKIYIIQQFQSLLNELDRNGVDACNYVKMQINEEADQFDINRFPNIQKIKITDWRDLANANFISSLEQIRNLKRLIIDRWSNEPLQLPSLRLPNLVHLELRRTNLPDNPLQFDSTGLRELEVTGEENLRRLANHARSGGCRSFKTLRLNEIDTDSVSRYLPAILKAAKGLEALNIRGRGFELIVESCIKVATASPRYLAELECDDGHEVPAEVGASIIFAKPNNLTPIEYLVKMEDSTIVDIATLIEDWAWNYFLDLEVAKGRKNENKGLERDDICFETNFKFLRIEHGEPDYKNFQPTGSKPWTLFKTVFKNNTNRTQAYFFKTERTTESVCLVCKEKGYTIGEEAQLTLKTPCEILELNAGFRHEMTFNKATENSVSEILSWGVDSNVEVPARYQTTAELVVEEMKYSGTFSVCTYFSGRVTVSLIRRKDGALLMPVTQNIVEIIKDVMASKNGRELKTFCSVEKGNKVKLITKGSCSFQFAMKQRVEINEDAIGEDGTVGGDQNKVSTSPYTAVRQPFATAHTNLYPTKPATAPLAYQVD